MEKGCLIFKCTNKSCRC